MRAYAGSASNVRVECTPLACFGEGGALAELLSLFEKLEVCSPTIESNNQIILMNEADKNPHGIDNNNLHGIEVLPTFLTIPNGV
jgi:DNA mismatch repair protein MSH3